MPSFVLVPIKDFALGKSRLAGVLSSFERHSLNLSLARHVLGACSAFFGSSRTVAISASPAVASLARDLGVQLVLECGDCDLNSALRQGAAYALQADASSVAVVPTDLPLLTTDALEGAFAAGRAGSTCVITPDRFESGTNFLHAGREAAELFCFGKNSFRRHKDRATQLGYEMRVHRCAALELDIDRPDDLHYLENMPLWRTSGSTIQRLLARRSVSIRTSLA